MTTAASNFKPEHVRTFFAHHLGASLPRRDQVLLHCSFHNDKTASLSVNLKDGVWKCHGRMRRGRPGRL